MKPVPRFQSQLLYRRSYRPKRVPRIRPVIKLALDFHPPHRFGLKPRLTTDLS